MSAPDTEKVSINVAVVDLGQIDLLVEQGFYSNRTDFYRTAARNLLQSHSHTIQQVAARQMMVIGLLGHGKRALEAYRARGEMLDIRVVGVLILEKDVTPELALATIRSIKVHGVLRMSAEVRRALADRIEA